MYLNSVYFHFKENIRVIPHVQQSSSRLDDLPPVPAPSVPPPPDTPVSVEQRAERLVYSQININNLYFSSSSIRNDNST